MSDNVPISVGCSSLREQNALPSRLLDLCFLTLSWSKGSNSCRICALGVALSAQSLGRVIDVVIGGGETGLFAAFCDPGLDYAPTDRKAEYLVAILDL
jgi:hypothetical protein